MQDRSQSFIGFDETPYGQIEPEWSVTLRSTHVLEIMKAKPESLDLSPEDLDSIQNVVSMNHSKVGLLLSADDSPIASGVLISQDLFLTSFHGIFDLKRNEGIKILFNFQKEEGGIDNSNVTIAFVVERYWNDLDLDYAILKLVEPVKDFVPISIDLPFDNEMNKQRQEHLKKFPIPKDQLEKILSTFHAPFSEEKPDSQILIHHPEGSAKMVSIARMMISNQFQFISSSAHDTAPCSSGAPYFTKGNKLSAIHCLYQNNQASHIYLKNIYNDSYILRKLFNEKGEPFHDPDLSELPQKKRDELIQFKYSGYFERSKPEYISKKLGELLDATHARHHIIPMRSLGFLWWLGKENVKLWDHFNELAVTDNLGIADIEYALWNLFIGPMGDLRADDESRKKSKNAPVQIEKKRPQSFPEDLWIAVHELYKKLEECLQQRFKIEKKRRIFSKDYHFLAFKREELLYIAKNEKATNWMEDLKSDDDKDELESYHKVHEALVKAVIDVKIQISKHPDGSFPLPYKADDWGQNNKGEYYII